MTSSGWSGPGETADSAIDSENRQAIDTKLRKVIQRRWNRGDITGSCLRCPIVARSVTRSRQNARAGEDKHVGEASGAQSHACREGAAAMAAVSASMFVETGAATSCCFMLMTVRG